MKTMLSFRFMLALLTSIPVALLCTTFAQENPVASPGSGVNLAVVAKPSGSYVSGDTSLAALNDENDPRSSRDRRRGSYGNWNRTGTQWVQYD